MRRACRRAPVQAPVLVLGLAKPMRHPLALVRDPRSGDEGLQRVEDLGQRGALHEARTADSEAPEVGDDGRVIRALGADGDLAADHRGGGHEGAGGQGGVLFAQNLRRRGAGEPLRQVVDRGPGDWGIMDP